MLLRRPGPGVYPPIKNRGDCGWETCAITPECAVTAEPAAKTESAGPQDAIKAAARSGQKPGLCGLDSDAGMRSVFESQRRRHRYRSGPHERLGTQGIGTEDIGLLGDPALLRASPGESGFVTSAGRERIFAQIWD